MYGSIHGKDGLGCLVGQRGLYDIVLWLEDELEWAEQSELIDTHLEENHGRKSTR